MNILGNPNFFNSKNFWTLTFIFLAGISLTLIFRDESLLTGRPLTEDAYYSFTVARNIALGKGFTVSDGVLTNGFQPLFTLILSIVYLITNGDKFYSLRIILFLEWLIYILTAILLGRIAKNSIKNLNVFRNSTNIITIIVPYIYLSCVSVFLLHFNGLETGLLLLFFALLWFLYQKDFTNNCKKLFIYSVLLGLLVLIRIDTVFFVILFALSQFLYSKAIFKEKLLRFFIVSTTSFVVSLPWWLYNYIFFGSFIPTSGIAQQSIEFNIIRIRETLIALSQNVMPLVYMGTATLEGFMSNIIRILFIYISFLILKKIWKENKNQFIKNILWQRTIIFSKIFLLSMVLLILYYTIAFHSTWFYFRYFSPLVLISVFFIGMIISYLINRIPKLKFFIFLFLFPISVSIYLIWQGRYTNDYYNHQFSLVKIFVSESEYVGAYQSGTLGYFHDRTINLDGKTNVEAIKYKDNLLKYIERKNIKWLCDWKWKIEGLLSSKNNLNADKWLKVDEKRNFLLVKKSNF